MATTMTLTGRLADITSRPVERTTRVSVKKPAYAPGPGVEITTTQPVAVATGEDGTFSISVVEGLGWLYLDGDGWSDSIRFVAAEGMATVWEAVVNALPHHAEVKKMLLALYEAYEQSKAGQALPPYLVESALRETYATKQEFLAALQDRADDAVAAAISTDASIQDAARLAVRDQVAAAENTTSLIDNSGENAGQLVKTDSNGKLTVTDAAIITGSDVPNKKYVDNAASAARWQQGQIPYNQDLNTFLTLGVSYASVGVGRTLVNAPGAAACLVTVESGPGKYFRQSWFRFGGLSAVPEEYFRWTLDGGITWSEWMEAAASTVESVAQPTHRRAVLKHRSRLRRGGVIGTNGATPVALTFDHGFGNFRDKVLPVLQRLGLPCTAAFNDGQMGNAENGGATWADLQQWAIDNGVEYAHHARSHADAPESALDEVLTGSITAAAENWPALATDAFIMPGVSGTKWAGFNGGNDTRSWWEHPAGRTIADNFPVVSGTTAGYYVPMMGGEDNTWTMYRYSFDTEARADTFMAKVKALAGTGMGIAGFMHPSVLDSEGKTSVAKLTEVLEFLAAERDAGRVEVLTLSGFAYADTSTSRRMDLGTSWDSGDQCVVDLGENTAWLRGAQVVVTTVPETSGQVPVTVADDTGRTSTVVYDTRAGVPVRRSVTLPVDAKRVTVTCPGRDRTIYPV